MNTAVLQIATVPALTIYVLGPHAVHFVLSKLLIDVFGFILRNFPEISLPLLMNRDPNLLGSKLGSRIGFF